MKTKIFFSFLLFSLCQIIYSQIPTFQVTKGIDDLHFHDLNIEPTNDGSLDFVVAGNLFDTGLNNHTPFLMRIDHFGNLIWFTRYIAPEIESTRCFDIVVLDDVIAMTGSAELPNLHKVLIAEFNATSGAFIHSKFYDILDPAFNGRGLHIIATQSVPVPGYVVGGFVSNLYPLNISNLNFGFVLRTDINLSPIWTSVINTNTGANVDYDMVNNVTETSNGFFLTGSATSINISGVVQQGVLAHKIDFLGAFLWDVSYTFGTTDNVSVDAHFDIPSQQLHMLCNYQDVKYFGNTAISDVSGSIDLSKSWVTSDTDNPDKYGFTIKESVNSPNNLLISGYDKDESWTDNQGISQTGQSNIFTYEFDMNTTLSVSPPYQYLVPHAEPQWDEFNFWNTQMPLIYYPDMSLVFKTGAGLLPNYFHVGYRIRNSINFTETELVKTLGNLMNDCENLVFAPTLIPLEPYVSDVLSASETADSFELFLIEEALPHNVYTCNPGIGIGENELLKYQLFPNPTKDYITIKLSQHLTTYNIIDTSGRVLIHNFYVQEKPIDVRKLESGIYILELYDNGKLIASDKFIKQ